MIKLIITANNDILLKKLEKKLCNYDPQIQVIYLPTTHINGFIAKNKKKNLIIFDQKNSSINLLANLLKNPFYKNIIILILNFNDLNHLEKSNINKLFRKNKNFSLFEILTSISKISDESINLEKNIDNIFWRMGFCNYLKGTNYLKDAVIFAYLDRNLLFDIQTIIKKVANKNQVSNFKLVRSDMDKTLNNTLDLLDVQKIHKIFGNLYDGRKISLRYYIDLCIQYLIRENKKDKEEF